MYFPYLRGRQFELIAVRSLLEMNLLHDKIIPIIEPVKLSSTFFKTFTSFSEHGRKISLIHNPQVGSITSSVLIDDKSSHYDKVEKLLNDKNILKAHILNEDSVNEMKLIEKFNIKKSEIITITTNPDYIKYYKEIFDGESKYNLVSDARTFRRGIKDLKVVLDDKYEKRKRNQDYMGIDEFFSDEHIFYKDDGYIGFSDFSVVGSGYFELGFAQYAVALHITYFDSEKNLRIKHFVSDSNDDIRDLALKYYEVLTKLNQWALSDGKGIQTFALTEFLKQYKNKIYPGLGTAKKLAIMHHIELISQYFRSKE